MLVYLSVLIITTGMIWSAESLNKDILIGEFTISPKKAVFYSFLISGFILVTLGSIRSITVGYDLSSYQEYFDSGYYYNIEYGYVFLSKFIKGIGLGFESLLLVIQLLVVIPVLLVIYKLSDKKWMSIFLYQSLYLYVNSFNILRQSVAMSIVLLAIYYLVTVSDKLKATVIFGLLVFIASSFHVTAYFSFVFLIFKNIDINKKYIVHFLIFSIVILLFRNNIMSFLMELFNREYYSQMKLEFGVSTILVLLYISLLLLWETIPMNKFYQENKFFSNIIIFSLLLNLFWAWFPNHARVMMYFYLVISVLLPNSLSNISDQKFYDVRVNSLIVVFTALYIFQLLFRDYGGVLPYLIRF